MKLQQFQTLEGLSLTPALEKPSDLNHYPMSQRFTGSGLNQPEVNFSYASVLMEAVTDQASLTSSQPSLEVWPHVCGP